MSIYCVHGFWGLAIREWFGCVVLAQGLCGCRWHDSWSCCLWKLDWAARSIPNMAYTHVVGSRLHRHIPWASRNTWSSLKNKWPRRRMTKQETSILFYDPGLDMTHQHLYCILLVTRTTSNATQEEMTYGVSIRRQRLSGHLGDRPSQYFTHITWLQLYKSSRWRLLLSPFTDEVIDSERLSDIPSVSGDKQQSPVSPGLLGKDCQISS